MLIERLPAHASRSKADLIDLFAPTRFERWEFLTGVAAEQGSGGEDQMFSIEAADDGTNHASAISMLDQPNWSLDEYLKLLDGIQSLPPEQQQEAVRKFYETHPRGVGLRTMLANENYPVSPPDSKNMLHLHDAAGKVRARLGVGPDGNPLLEFLDSAGSVTHRYPPN